MQKLQPLVVGTRDYIGSDAVALKSLRDTLDRVFHLYAYSLIYPPILEQSAPFLDRSGEDIRRRMYIFLDPKGDELCLRPELTIPVGRAYLRDLQRPDGQARFSMEREARLSYLGPAFKYETIGEGRYRQFYQAGAELIGAKLREAADAEILALAVDSLTEAGITDATVQLGDIGILHAFIDGLPLSERSKARLRRFVLWGSNEASVIRADADGTGSASESGTNPGELGALLSSMEPRNAELLIEEIFALANVRHVGGRAASAIVDRLTSRASQHSNESISRELIQAVGSLTAIQAAPDTALDMVREHFKAFKINDIDPLIDRCHERLDLFTAYGTNPLPLIFNVGLRRGLEYYTGFIFEIFSKSSAHLGHLCGGGRYDGLLEALGADQPIAAVGFGIDLDRLLIALQRSNPTKFGNGLEPQALVVGAGATRQEECIRVSTLLRKMGWSVETETSDRSARRSLSHALKRNVQYMVFVGEEEIKRGQVRIKRLCDRNEELVTLSAVDAYVSRENALQKNKAL